jgi:hypothetical protein
MATAPATSAARRCQNLDSRAPHGENGDGTREHVAALLLSRKYMLAVIGNVLAGLGVFGLFTATLRLSMPARRS